MEPMLRPVKAKRISDQVFEQLRELIYRGQLKPGEQLTPERELAELLGVSRTSVRNAINRLICMGLLEQRQGRGTFVRTPDYHQNNPLALALSTQESTLEDLLEVRMGLECHAAALAALRADDKDIRLLRQNVAEMQEEVKSGRLGTEADVGFHMAVSYATRNPAQVQVMKNFSDFLFYAIRQSRVQLYEEPLEIEKILQQHKEILHCIEHQEAEKAYHAMRRHIRFVIDFVKRS